MKLPSVSTVGHWTRTIVIILSCIAASSLLTGVAFQLADREPALQIIALDDAGEVALRDGRLSIYTKIARTRSCRAETSHWLYTVVEHGPVDHVRLWVPIAGGGPIPAGDIGELSYVLSVPLPPGLWPGKWFWVSDRIEYCGLFGTWFPRRFETPPLPIDIERTRASPEVPVTSERGGKTTVRSRSPLAPTATQGKQ